LSEPVLVIHGVANRDREAFTRQVEELQASVGRQWKFIPTFWGHLGAEVHGITDTIPEIEGVEVRAMRGAPASAVAASLLRGVPAGPLVRSGRNAVEIVAQAAVAVIGQPPSATGVRAEEVTEAIQTAIQQHWSDTRWLQLLESQHDMRGVDREPDKRNQHEYCDCDPDARDAAPSGKCLVRSHKHPQKKNGQRGQLAA